MLLLVPDKKGPDGPPGNCNKSVMLEPLNFCEVQLQGNQKDSIYSILSSHAYLYTGMYPWLFLFSRLDFGPDCLYYWIIRTTSEGTYRPQPWNINVRPGQLVVIEEWPALECITLKVQVHPSHCGIGKLKLHTTHREKERATADHVGCPQSMHLKCI